jgi:hypothetical protein
MNDISLEELIRRCREGGRALTGLTFLQPELHVHHANEDHRDNRLENLVVMAAQEHTAHHGNRTSWANVAIAAEISTVESIEPAGEEETFDLTMESPHNNYVANGFVVHNSGKTCSAILWSLLVPGPVIVITRAAARFQYAREWEKYTTCRPYVIRPASTMKKKSETFDQYLLSDEKRHVVVAAWESLQLYADKLVDMRPSAVIWDEAHLGKSSKRWESIPLPELPEDPKEAIKLALDQDAEARSRNGFISDNDGNRVMILPLDNTATAAARLARAAWRRCATTATPVKDRVRDLWAQLDIVEPDAWGSATCWLDRYCLVAETPVLMGDGTYRPVGAVQEGDEVIGWSRANGKRFLHRTKVIWTGTRQAEVVQLRMESGRKIICTRDHHWLQTRNPQVEKQYRSVFEEVGEADRTSRRKLKALQPLGAEPQDVSGLNTAAFKLGYLRGAVDGDGHTRIRKEKRLVLTGGGHKGRETRSGRKLPPRYYSVFFNAAERVHLERVVTYLRDLGMQTTGIKQKSDNMYVVGVHGKKSYRRIMCSRSSTAIGSFRRGWLSGMYDAEGSYDCISQYKDVNPDVYDYLEKSLTHFGFRTRLHEEGVFILGGRWEMLRFFDLVRPALSRKVDAVFARNPNFRFDVRAPDRILTAFPLKSPRTVVSIQTETGNYVAAGYGSKNCDRKPGTYGGYDTTGTSNLEELTGRLAKVTHHIAYTTTHRQLPPKRRQSVYVGAEDQIPPSAGFANELKKAQLRGATAVLEVKLAEAASRKRKAVLGIIEDHVYAGGKVVMFTGRRKDVDVLGELIRKSDAVKAKSAGVWAAHGENSSEERSNIVLEYMAHPGPCVLVGTGDSFGESLNMQDTDAALFVMLPYTPGQIRQWEGRFCRLGQKRPVTIYYVIAEGSVDEHVADILIRKLPAVEQVAKDEELAAAKDVIAGFDSQQSPDAFADKILAKIAKAAAQTESDDELDSEEDWE